MINVRCLMKEENERRKMVDGKVFSQQSPVGK